MRPAASLPLSLVDSAFLWLASVVSLAAAARALYCPAVAPNCTLNLLVVLIRYSVRPASSETCTPASPVLADTAVILVANAPCTSLLFSTLTDSLPKSSARFLSAPAEMIAFSFEIASTPLFTDSVVADMDEAATLALMPQFFIFSVRVLTASLAR